MQFPIKLVIRHQNYSFREKPLWKKSKQNTFQFHSASLEYSREKKETRQIFISTKASYYKKSLDNWIVAIKKYSPRETLTKKAEVTFRQITNESKY